MKKYTLLAFDLDDTLAPSKSALPARMASELAKLLEISQVCVISGGNFAQFQNQLLNGLHLREELFTKLHLMPTCGTRYMRYKAGEWQPIYVRDLSLAERQAAMRHLETEAKKLDLWETETWGPILEDRGSQITFSALGQSAPLDAKKAWDPNGTKKEMLRLAVAPKLPELEVRGGGSTSIDITRKGVDKAYGLEELVKETGIPLSEILFIGDRLDAGGNDYPVLRLGVDTHPVTGWEDTADFIAKYVAECVGN